VISQGLGICPDFTGPTRSGPAAVTSGSARGSEDVTWNWLVIPHEIDVCLFYWVFRDVTWNDMNVMACFFAETCSWDLWIKSEKPWGSNQQGCRGDMNCDVPTTEGQNMTTSRRRGWWIIFYASQTQNWRYPTLSRPIRGGCETIWLWLKHQVPAELRIWQSAALSTKPYPMWDQ
jgi:hypothetical protein